MGLVLGLGLKDITLVAVLIDNRRLFSVCSSEIILGNMMFYISLFTLVFCIQTFLLHDKYFFHNSNENIASLHITVYSAISDLQDF